MSLTWVAKSPLYFRVILLFFCRTNFWDSMTAAANQDGGYCTAFAVRRALKIMLVCCIGGRCLYCTSKESTSSYSCLAATADDFCKNCFAWRLLLLYRVSNQILTNILKENDKNCRLGALVSDYGICFLIHRTYLDTLYALKCVEL